jgi:hypothetical protein
VEASRRMSTAPAVSFNRIRPAGLASNKP